jgi:hypothetical protein
MRPLAAAALVALLYALHQDVWLWREARPIVFGVLPVGLFYHAAYTVVTAVTAHAVEYANLDAGAGAAFVERVRQAARQAFRSATGHNCLAVFAAADGHLTVTIGGESASQPLPA